MLHAMNPGTFVQPHKHENPDKREIFLILQGRVLVVAFNYAGKITDHSILNTVTGNFGIEIPTGTWHTLIALEENSVVYEVKDGPYDPDDDKDFAAWAPAESDPEKHRKSYLNTILTSLSIPVPRSD